MNRIIIELISFKDVNVKIIGNNGCWDINFKNSTRQYEYTKDNCNRINYIFITIFDKLQI
jgi:hypothetical protein